MAVFIPDIFSGYLNGMRQANEDNWKDLSNYNSVQNGQLDNAYKMATFDPAVRSSYDQADMLDNKTLLDNLATNNATISNAYWVTGRGPQFQGMNSALKEQYTNALLPTQYAVNQQNGQLTLQYAPITTAQQAASNQLAIDQAQQQQQAMAGPSTGGDPSLTLTPNAGTKAADDGTKTTATDAGTTVPQPTTTAINGTVYDKSVVAPQTAEDRVKAAQAALNNR